MTLTNCIPTAYAEIHGTASFPKLHGMAYFYDVTNGTVVVAEVEGLPDEDTQGAGSFFGFHIHEGSRCSGTPQDLLSATGGHYNPTYRPHPYHAGDLPPLLSMAGSAWCAVYTGRFRPEQVIGRTLVIHDKSDDFQTQPSGNSGKKIACGVIRQLQ